MKSFPWVPLFTIERSGQPELTVSGILSVVADDRIENKARQLLALGDVDYQLWSRSLLKPWQLLSNLVPLKDAYPKLEGRHFSLITASHSGESPHLCVLRELLDLAGLSEEILKCPSSMPLFAEARLKFKQDAVESRPLFHNCSGKHLGYLFALKAGSHRLENYLDPNGNHFVPLRAVLGALLNRPATSFQVTTDGCRLPNYAMSSFEMARLYLSLVNPSGPILGSNVSADVSPMLSCYSDLQKIMVAHPHLVGGTDRVDTNIMLGKPFDYNLAGKVVAKQGADGLLAIGIAPNTLYPSGVGILIKLASGFVERYMELISRELFRQLKLIDDPPPKADNEQAHIKIIFHFQAMN
jgi:L-asparaginase II